MNVRFGGEKNDERIVGDEAFFVCWARGGREGRHGKAGIQDRNCLHHGSAATHPQAHHLNQRRERQQPERRRGRG